MPFHHVNSGLNGSSSDGDLDDSIDAQRANLHHGGSPPRERIPGSNYSSTVPGLSSVLPTIPPSVSLDAATEGEALPTMLPQQQLSSQREEAPFHEHRRSEHEVDMYGGLTANDVEHARNMYHQQNRPRRRDSRQEKLLLKLAGPDCPMHFSLPSMTYDKTGSGPQRSSHHIVDPEDSQTYFTIDTKQTPEKDLPTISSSTTISDAERYLLFRRGLWFQLRYVDDDVEDEFKRFLYKGRRSFLTLISILCAIANIAMAYASSSFDSPWLGYFFVACALCSLCIGILNALHSFGTKLVALYEATHFESFTDQQNKQKAAVQLFPSQPSYFRRQEPVAANGDVPSAPRREQPEQRAEQEAAVSTRRKSSDSLGGSLMHFVVTRMDGLVTRLASGPCDPEGAHLVYEKLGIMYAAVSVAVAVVFYPQSQLCERQQLYYSSDIDPCTDYIAGYTVVAQSVLAVLFPFRCITALPFITICPAIFYLVRLAGSSDGVGSLIIRAAVNVVITVVMIVISLRRDRQSREMFESLFVAKAEVYRMSRLRKRLDKVLEAILPPSVLDRLAARQPVIDVGDMVFISICEVHDFEMWTTKVLTANIVHTINALHSGYDEAANHLVRSVERIKTIGDKYIVTCGLQKKMDNATAAHDLLLFGKMQMRTAGIVSGSSLLRNTPLSLKIVLHAGKLVGAIVGSISVSYDIFGPALETAIQVLAATSVKNSILATTPVVQAFPAGQYQFTAIGTLETLDNAEDMSTTDPTVGGTSHPSQQQQAAGGGAFEIFEIGRTAGISGAQDNMEGFSSLLSSPPESAMPPAFSAISPFVLLQNQKDKSGAAEDTTIPVNPFLPKVKSESKRPPTQPSTPPQLPPFPLSGQTEVHNSPSTGADITGGSVLRETLTPIATSAPLMPPSLVQLHQSHPSIAGGVTNNLPAFNNKADTNLVSQPANFATTQSANVNPYSISLPSQLQSQLAEAGKYYTTNNQNNNNSSSHVNHTAGSTEAATSLPLERTQRHQAMRYAFLVNIAWTLRNYDVKQTAKMVLNKLSPPEACTSSQITVDSDAVSFKGNSTLPGRRNVFDFSDGVVNVIRAKLRETHLSALIKLGDGAQIPRYILDRIPLRESSVAVNLSSSNPNAFLTESYSTTAAHQQSMMTSGVTPVDGAKGGVGYHLPSYSFSAPYWHASRSDASNGISSSAPHASTGETTRKSQSSGPDVTQLDTNALQASDASAAVLQTPNPTPTSMLGGGASNPMVAAALQQAEEHQRELQDREEAFYAELTNQNVLPANDSTVIPSGGNVPADNNEVEAYPPHIEHALQQLLFGRTFFRNFVHLFKILTTEDRDSWWELEYKNSDIEASYQSFRYQTTKGISKMIYRLTALMFLVTLIAASVDLTVNHSMSPYLPPPYDNMSRVNLTNPSVRLGYEALVNGRGGVVPVPTLFSLGGLYVTIAGLILAVLRFCRSGVSGQCEVLWGAFVMFCVTLGIHLLPINVTNGDSQYIFIVFLSLAASTTLLWYYMVGAVMVEALLCIGMQYYLYKQVFLSTVALVILTLIALAYSSFHGEKFFRSHFEAVSIKTALISASEDEVFLQRSLQSLLFPSHLVDVVTNFSLGLVPPSTVFIEQLNELCLLEIRTHHLNEAIFKPSAPKRATIAVLPPPPSHSGSSAAAVARGSGNLNTSSIRVASSTSSSEVSQHSYGALYLETAESIFAAIDEIVRESNKKFNPQWNAPSSRNDLDDEVADDVFLSSENPIQKLHTYGDSIVYAGPLREEKDNAVLQARLLRSALAICSVISGLRRAKRVADANRSVNKNQQSSSQAAQSRGHQSSLSTAHNILSQQQFTAIACCGFGYGAVIGSPKRVSYSVLGHVTRESSVLIRAAPEGFRGCTAAFQRVLSDSHRDNLRAEGLSVQFGQPTSWRVKGAGAIKMIPFADAFLPAPSNAMPPPAILAPPAALMGVAHECSPFTAAKPETRAVEQQRDVRQGHLGGLTAHEGDVAECPLLFGLPLVEGS